MSRHYFDPARENEHGTLPDLEVFFMDESDCAEHNAESDDPDAPYTPGWYYWPCFPGCLPDGDPQGPFDTEADAIEDAQDGY